MAHKKNKIKEILRKGGVPLGIFLDINDPHVVEMAGVIGFDFVCLEREHTTTDLSQLERLIYAADVAGVPVLVRMHELSADQIARTLDAGAMGVMLTLVQTKEQVVELLRSMKYPPLGQRGLHPTVRALGLSSDFDPKRGEYVKVANEETMACVLIESKLGVDNIDEIASVDGLDCICYGPSDLSLDLDVLGQWEHPKLVAARDKIIKGAKDHNKSLLLFVGEPAGTTNAIKAGADIVLFAHDIMQVRLMFEDGIKTMRACAKSLGV